MPPDPSLADQLRDALQAEDADRVWELVAQLRAQGPLDRATRLSLFQGNWREYPPQARAIARGLIEELRTEPDDAFAEAMHVFGRAVGLFEDPERIALYREALSRSPETALADRLRVGLADIFTLLGDESEATRLVDAIDPESLPTKLLNVYALQLQRLGRYADAEEAWLALLGHDDLTPRLRCWLWATVAHTRMSLGRLDDAAVALDAAEAVDPIHDVMHMYIGSIRFDVSLRLGDLDGAEAALDSIPPVVSSANDAALIEINRTTLAALRGHWDTEAFRELLGHTRADLRSLGAIGSVGAAVTNGDRHAAEDAMLAAERAQASSLIASSPDVACLAEQTAEACDRPGVSRALTARAWRFAARAWEPLDENRAAEHRERLLQVGAHLVGPFELMDPLGRGGGGTVFEAVHVSGTVAAVKVLHDVNPTTRDLLENELRAVAALDHPCIATLLDTGVVDVPEAASHPALTAGTRWIATELIDGGDLLPLCGTVTWARSLSLMAGILDALAHAHARDLLHLDIKPANVLLHPSGTPVLVDFGLARGIGARRPALLSGTPEYMAPELFDRGWMGVGPPTDLYAAACTLFQLLSGEPPFAGSMTEVQQQHARGVPVLTPTTRVPVGLQDWLHVALARYPADRFPTAAAAAQALMALPRPTGPRRSAAPPPKPSEMPTVVLQAVFTSNAVRTGPQQGADLPEPPMPRMWTRTERRPRPEIATASLGLFRYRRPPLVGRRAERSMLWSSLVLAESGTPVVVAVTGSEGSGRRALVRWLIERAREVGVVCTRERGPGRVSVAHLHEPGLEQLGAAREALVLVTAATWPERWPDAVELPLRELEACDLRLILDQSLHLTEELTSDIVARSRGLPGRALAVLADLVELDRLLDGPEGHHLRPGAELPDPD